MFAVRVHRTPSKGPWVYEWGLRSCGGRLGFGFRLVGLERSFQPKLYLQTLNPLGFWTAACRMNEHAGLLGFRQAQVWDAPAFK